MKDIFGKMAAIGLAGAIAVVCFTACGKTNETTQTTENTTVEETAAHKVGGWTIPADSKITDEEFAIFNKGIEGLVGVEYEPVAYLGSQLVAGTNHCFLCKATVVYPGTTPQYKLVYIYEKLDGTEEILNIADIELPGAGDADSNPIPGGWSYADDPSVDEKTASVVDKATEKLLGAEYEPVAYIGSQVVAGMNHAVLCRITAISPDAEDGYALLYIYEDLNGGFEILEINEITLSIDA